MPDFDPTKMPPVPSLWPPPEQPAPEYVYALETFRFEGPIEDLKRGTAVYLTVARKRGWTRLLLASEVTSNPKQHIQIWKIPAPYPGKEQPSDPAMAEAEVNLLHKYRHFIEHLALFERTILHALPYDPGAER